MSISKGSSVIRGVYKTRLEAEKALNLLKNKKNNFADSDILVHIPYRSNAVNSRISQNGSSNRSRAIHGMAFGVAVGAFFIGALALLSVSGIISSPAIVSFAPAGPFLTCMAGIGIGVTVGGITGALIGLGIPEYETERIRDNDFIKNNGILITVKTGSIEEATKVISCLKNTGAESICTKDEISQTVRMLAINQNGAEAAT